MADGPPPPGVLAAYGLAGTPVRLPGGQGTAWRSGDTVLKPAGDAAEAAWTATVLAALPPSPEFRVAPPVAAGDGRWVVDGWAAWRLIPGQPQPHRLDDVLRTAGAFHRALSHLPRPAFLDTRDDPWTYAERLAFGEVPFTGEEHLADVMAPVVRARRPLPTSGPLADPAQPVHGDLLGNVLFADGLAPAVIDWPVYFRPPGWALAVAVIDALVWHGAPAAAADRASGPHGNQLLLRALIYRIATNEGRRRHGLTGSEPAGPYRPVADLVVARLAGQADSPGAR
jgi:uncharacterized protein (TIGR02569 family)